LPLRTALALERSAALGVGESAPALRPPQAAAAVVGAAIAITAVLGAAELGAPTELLVAHDIVLVATAVTLLAPLAAGRWPAAAASGLVVELGAAPIGHRSTGPGAARSSA